MPIARWAVLSSNGEESWCGRRKHQVVSHRGSLYLLGGFGGYIGGGRGPDANLNDVWKSTEGVVRVLLWVLWICSVFHRCHGQPRFGVQVFRDNILCVCSTVVCFVRFKQTVY